jgi:nucleotide-binding universal stress UspA family protein
MSALIQVSEPKQRSKFKQILIATDFSDVSARAFGYAVAIARRLNSSISLVHATPPDPHEPIPIYPLPKELDRSWLDAEEQLKKIGEQIDDLHPHLFAPKGRVWDVLASVIRQENVDLVVLGTRGRGGLTKLALGSVAEDVLQRIPCPVLTVGPNVPQAGPETTEFKRILFATDFGTTTEKALHYAMSLAETYGAGLVLLHMVPPIPLLDLGAAAYCPGPYIADTLINWQRRTREEGLKKLKAMVPPNHSLPVEFVVGMDFLPEGILDAAAEHKVQLIVMGTNWTPSPRMASHSPWALTHEVIGHAICPVLTVAN